MRRFLVLSLLSLTVIGAALAYVASPFVAAWNLREAIRTSDTATLERKIDWPRFRESLKTSLSRSTALRAEVDAAGAEVKPTLWQRVKAAFGATMTDRFVETYVTPQGLPKLFAMRKTWNSKVRGNEDDSKQPWDVRVREFYGRIKRAEFRSLGTIEIEVAERQPPTRHVIATLELSGFEWHLVGVTFNDVAPAAETVSALPAP